MTFSSWFSGYTWSPLRCSNIECSARLGWKFEACVELTDWPNVFYGLTCTFIDDAESDSDDEVLSIANFLIRVLFKKNNFRKSNPHNWKIHLNIKLPLKLYKYHFHKSILQLQGVPYRAEVHSTRTSITVKIWRYIT